MVSTRLWLPPVGPQSPRREWAVLSVDRVLDPFRVFHIELSWLVCSAKNVRDLLGALLRRAQQLGLCLVPVPTYARSSHLNVHPFIAHPFLPLPGPPALLRLCEEALVARFGFVGDDERVTDWQELGLGPGAAAARTGRFGGSSALTTSLQQQQQQASSRGRPLWLPSPRGQQGWGVGQGQQSDRQYCHRAGWAFLRVASSFSSLASAGAAAAASEAGGFLWLNNRLQR
jgi:hypothetical protein